MNRVVIIQKIEDETEFERLKDASILPNEVWIYIDDSDDEKRAILNDLIKSEVS